MSKLKFTSYLLLLLTLFQLTGCETEIDIIAPKKDVTVIYGLLEADREKHYIRINRAFVGEEAASEMAARQGITEYSDAELDAFIEEFNPQTNEVVRTWKLEDEYITSKEEGIFFSDSNKVYFFEAKLNVDMHYRIRCIVNVAGEAEKVVEAETAVIGDQSSTGDLIEIRLLKPTLIGSSSDPTQADRAEVDFVANGDYRSSLEVIWRKAEGGVAYTSYYRFYYTEVDKATGARSRDSLLFAIGSKRVDPSSSGQVEFSMNPEEFFSRISTVIDDYDYENATFDRVASDTLQFFLEIADNTLATYMEVNQPVTEILQEQPEYTNITNGIGVFASRMITSTRKKDRVYESGRVFTANTLEELLYSNKVNAEDSYNTQLKGFTRPGRCNDAIKDCR